MNIIYSDFVTISKKYFFFRNNSEIANSSKKNYLNALITFNFYISKNNGQIINENSNFLDLGCGDGSFVKFLNESNINAVGVDVEDVNLEKDRTKFPENSFENILLNSVVEHISNIDHLFNEIRRILKPGGNLIIVTPNFSYDYKNFYNDPTHIRPFTHTSMLKILQIYKFNNIIVKPWTTKYKKIINLISFPFFFCAKILPFKNNDHIFIPSFLKGKSTSLIAVCKK